ncbi:hydroxymethylbilane synthase [Parvularcula flava]|uniref:Porphobilinogen deaminase n=1 Tax=Aquisalinus luteolus TaxID=1566827 RepID=A0A8J3A2B9_9PROT|nr:hydroxymethylbilane synthase [Aquisalinus luteolus]NHK28204.1 hydroxymethylbilane synthase [Aquisalinus luteolus]GGH97777.1 porphobilinogen deaminase [Aquisalinus luteolus]
MPDRAEFTIASRKSPLAVRQSEMVREMILKAVPDAGEIPIRTYVTEGDRRLSGSLAEIGGKGLFTKEVEQALLDGVARIGVHSMKDMPAEMPDGLMVAAVPVRNDARDAFISPIASSPWEMPKGGVVGTSSVRRAAQLLHRRPDLQIVPMRGNVGTRLGKLADGQAQATFLAEAGLERLDRNDVERTVLEPEEMLPAVSQGVLCVQCRADDEEAARLLEKIECRQTSLASAAERAFLTRLDGSCRTPIAGLATMNGSEMRFRAQLLTLDGREEVYHDETVRLTGDSYRARIAEAMAQGLRIAEEIYEAASPAIRQLIRQASH